MDRAGLELELEVKRILTSSFTMSSSELLNVVDDLMINVNKEGNFCTVNEQTQKRTLSSYTVLISENSNSNEIVLLLC